MRPQSIMVVGAGIFGVTAAIELGRRGYAVSLFDPGPLPHPKAASTDISKVIRMDYGADELYMALMEVAFEGWDAWNRRWEEPLYHQDGFPAQADGTLKVANHGPGWRIHPDAPRVVPPETEARFRAFFRDTFPGLAEAPLIGGRLCFYCDTWDGNFWIDHDPERPGLIVAAGDSGHGFKFAPVLGDLIADVLERRANPYAARFAWRYRGELATEEARYGEATADS